MSAVLLFLHIAIALAGAIRFRRPRLKLLPWYFGFIAFAGVIGGTGLAVGSPAHYRALWWALEFAHDAILTLLCLELVSAVLPRRFVEPAAVFFCGFLAISIARNVPNASTASLLAVSVSGMATAGVLLTVLAFVEINWRDYGTIAAGLALLVAGTLLPSVTWITRGISQTVLQLADLPGLVIMAGAGLRFQIALSERASVKSRIVSS